MNATRLIMAGKFVDGFSNQVHKNKFLAIKDGVITAIGDISDLSQNHEIPVDDFSHGIILPSLIDCSINLARSASIATNQPAEIDKTRLLARHIYNCHSHGVLGVAENDDIDELLKNYQKNNSEQHPLDIKTSNNYLKIHYSNSIDDDSETSSLLTSTELHHIVKNKGKRKVIVVANGSQQVKEALKAGCDGIEQGYLMGTDNLETMAKNNILWIPNVIRAENSLSSTASGGSVCCRFSLRYAAPGMPIPGAEKFWRKILEDQLQQLTFARKIGVKTATGTGAGHTGILHGESVIEEIKLFMKAGYSLAEAMQAASENSAIFFNMGKLGALKVGRQATFLVTRGSVKQLPRKLSYLENIYVNGSSSTDYRKNPVKTV